MSLKEKPNFSKSYSRREFLIKGTRAGAGLGLAFLTRSFLPFSVEAGGESSSFEHFFPETNFYVRDREAPFLSGFEKFGGLATLGYPISRQYKKDGVFYQTFQRGILKWHPETKELGLAPVMEWLHQEGKDDWLLTSGIPKRKEGSYSLKELLSWLTHIEIKKAFFKNPNPEKIKEWDPVAFYGRPTSYPEVHGPFINQRFENYVFQFWQEEVAGAPPKNSVVGVLIGNYARAAGLIPREALIEEESLRSENPTPKKEEQKEAIYRGDVIYRGPHVPEVAITIDDGWWPSQIEKQVEIAQKYGIKLTFFLVGRVLKMPAWEKSITKALEAGCELQNHTFNHAWLTKCSSEEIAWEIKAAKEVIFDLTKGEGNSGRYLRPPFGAYDGRVVSIAHSLGLEVAMWSNGSGGTSRDKDGNLISAGACFNNLVATTGWGSIPLVHTNWNDTGALDPYVSWIKEKGMSPVLLSELVPPRDLV